MSLAQFDRDTRRLKLEWTEERYLWSFANGQRKLIGCVLLEQDGYAVYIGGEYQDTAPHLWKAQADVECAARNLPKMELPPLCPYYGKTLFRTTEQPPYSFIVRPSKQRNRCAFLAKNPINMKASVCWMETFGQRVDHRECPVLEEIPSWVFVRIKSEAV